MKTRVPSRRQPRTCRPALEQLECRATPATLSVSTLADSGAGSLRQAILNANNEGLNPGLDTIVFTGAAAGGTIGLFTRGGTQFGPNAFEITSNITIVGAGETIRRDGAAPNFRLFFVSSAGNLILSNLTLSNGFARGGDGGTNLAVNGGGGGGGLGAGGAIYNQGTVSILNSTLSGNTAQGGNGGAGADTVGTFAGGGGGGGGMGGNGGTTPDTAPQTDGGAGGGGFFGNGVAGAGSIGGGGGGTTADAIGAVGGVANGGAGGPNATIGTVGGLGGGGGGGGEEGSGAAGGGGGGGGGEDGTGGAGGYGAGGGGGSNAGATARAGGAGGFNAGSGGSALATQGSGGGGGGAGSGGAIFNDAGTITIFNSTISGNSAIGGTGGTGGGTASAGNAGLGTGGGILNRNGTVTARSNTFTNNTAASFGRGINNIADGGTATVTLHNSILGQAVNGASDFDNASINGGTQVTNGTGNLIRVNVGFTGTVVSSADPLLGALQNNGGPTFTHLPNIGSPAINAGSNVNTGENTDQRGFGPRISGGTVDIGAVETGAVAPFSLDSQGTLTFTDFDGVVDSLAISRAGTSLTFSSVGRSIINSFGPAALSVTVPLAGVSKMVVNTGAGDDRVRFDFGAAGFSFTLGLFLDTGAGTDTLLVSGNAHFSLTNALLRSSDGARVQLAGVERAILQGGTSFNIFDARGFTGTLVLDGGAGDDRLFGGSGRNILIGGLGKDILLGGASDDILIGGRVTLDLFNSSFTPLLDKWAGPLSYAARVAQIRAGTGLPAGIKLSTTTVPNDGSIDTLTGAGGLDWFWAFLPNDLLKDKNASEILR